MMKKLFVIIAGLLLTTNLYSYDPKVEHMATSGAAGSSLHSDGAGNLVMENPGATTPVDGVFTNLIVSGSGSVDLVVNDKLQVTDGSNTFDIDLATALIGIVPSQAVFFDISDYIAFDGWNSGGEFGIGCYDPSEKLEVVGNIYLKNDNNQLIFGAGKDASIYYDDADLVIDPDVLGGGSVWVKGNATFDGSVIGTDATFSAITATDGGTNVFTASAAGIVPVVIKGAASQTANLLNLTDSSDTNVFEVLSTGHILNTDGMRTIQAEYGPAIWTHIYGEDTPEHTNQTGVYDHTGGAQERLFTKSAGDDFASADVGNWILLTGANLGAVAEIKTYLSTTTVIVEGMDWDGDLASQTFQIFKHPGFISAGAVHEFSVESDGEFEVFSYDFTGSKVAEVELDAAGDNIDALYVKAEANGNNIVTSAEFHYHSGALAAGEVGGGIFVTMDDTEATTADATTIMGAIALSTTDASDATKRGLVVLSGFDEALTIQGSPAIDPAFGYEVSGGGVTETDRVNGGAGDGNAFLVAGNDLEIFDADDDYILIGSATEFENIQVILATESSKDIEPDFFYSKAGGGWTALAIQSDGTDGFKSSGNIIFADPGDWSKDDESMDGTAITDAFYVAIQRTRAAVIATLPTEDYFKTYASQNTGMVIDGGGFIQPRNAADGSAPNNSIYYSTDQSVLVYKDSGGSVNDLY